MSIEIINFQPAFGLEVVRMWRRAFAGAMRLPISTDWPSVSEHLSYLLRNDNPLNLVAIDTQTSHILAYMSGHAGELDHLYVATDAQGQGLGHRLLDLARQRSPQGICLYTFARNANALGFYKSQGFVETARGYADSADNPWATEKEHLADVRLCWQPSKSTEGS